VLDPDLHRKSGKANDKGHDEPPRARIVPDVSYVLRYKSKPIERRIIDPAKISNLEAPNL
jgi:hypothetical protein